jgi:Protein of unknown function (DUF2924)
MPSPSFDREAIEAEIGRVRSLGVDALRSLWGATFRASPPPAFTKDLIARFLCRHLQEQGFGGLDPKIAKHLAGVVRGDWSRVDRPRRLNPGTLLVREYQDARHAVTVVANGFVWREATYASLSTVARAITGTNWNGPRFFGLRIDKESTISPEKADAPPRSPNGGTLAQATSSKSRRAVAIERPSGNATPAHPSLGDGESGQ